MDASDNNPFFRELREIKQEVKDIKERPGHTCAEHKDFAKSMMTLVTDVALIKAAGEASKEAMEAMEKRVVAVLEKLTEKSSRHDMWFYVAYGCLLCAGYAIAQISILVKL